MPMTSTWFPQMFTDVLIGIWIRFPEPTPGEPLALPDAEVAPPEPPPFPHEVPVTESRMPITSTWLPQTLIGALTGNWTPLPEPTPGECAVPPVAVVSACALAMPRPVTSRPPVVIPSATRRFVE